MADLYVSFPIVAGIREDIDPTRLDMPSLRRAENVAFDRDGELVKREGFKEYDVALGTDPSITAIFAHKDQLLWSDNGEMNLYGTKADDKAVLDNDLPIVRLRSIMRGGTVNSSGSLATVSAATDNTIALAWVNDDDGITVVTFDRNTEAQLASETMPTGGDTASAPRIIGTPTHYVVTWRVDADNEIQGARVDDAATPNAAVVLASDVKSGAHAYDVTVSGTTAAPTLVISYVNSSDELSVREFSVDSSLSTGDTFSDTSTTYSETAIWGELDEDNVWVVALDSANVVDLWVLDQSMSQAANTASVIDGTGSYTWLTVGKARESEVAIVAYKITSARPTGQMEYCVYDATGNNQGVSKTAYGWPECAPFFDGVACYLPVYVTLSAIDGTDPINCGHLLLRLFNTDRPTTAVNPQGVLPFGYNTSPQPAWPSGETLTTPQKPAKLSATEYAMGALRVEESTAARWTRVGYRFSSHVTRQYVSASMADSLYIAGGVVNQFTGDDATELGFFYYPFLDAAANITEATGGSLTTGGTYQHAVMYEWTDDRGNVHRSAPHFSTARSLSTGMNSFDVSFPYYRFTRKQDKGDAVRLVVYRSQNGPTLPFQRSTSSSNSLTTSGEATLTDSRSDASLQSSEILYDTGGILDHAPVPPASVIAEFGDRIFGVDDERPTRIWFTKQFTPGDGLGHNETLQILLEDTSAPINGMAAMDGVLYALKRDGIYRLAYGDGPNNAGGGTVYAAPTLVTRRAGCDSPLSVLEGPDGIYFAGVWEDGRTIFLFPRGEGEPVPIGDRVRDTLDTYPVVRRAVHRQTESRVEFVVVDDATAPSAGRLLYYHYSNRDESGVGQWTIASLQDGNLVPLDATVALDESLAGPTTWIAAYDSTNDTYHAMAQRLTGSRTDDGVSYSMVIETGDMRPFGADGWGSVRAARPRIRYPGNQTTVLIQDSLDSGQSFATGGTWALGSTGDVLPSSGDVLELEHWHRHQVTDAVRYRVTITSPLGDGDEQGVSVVNFTLRAAPKRGAKPVTGSHRR